MRKTLADPVRGLEFLEIKRHALAKTPQPDENLATTPELEIPSGAPNISFLIIPLYNFTMK